MTKDNSLLAVLMMVALFALPPFVVLAQAPEDCGMDSSLFPPENPNPVIQYGGRFVTSTGTLRVLMIWVRFADDNETTSDWPDPAVLPEWAQRFVDTAYSPSGNYYSGTVSHYFYENSYGKMHVIGDVYYVTTDSTEAYYHRLAAGPPVDPVRARSAIEMEVLNKLDNPPYNVDFRRYDNWTFGTFNHSPNPDNKVDRIWFRTRNLHDSNLPADQRPFGIGWAVLDCPDHIRDGVTIDGGLSFPGSGVGMFADHLYPGLLVYHIVGESDVFANTQVQKIDADGRFSWKVLHRGPNPGGQSDDVIDRDSPDRFGGYSETERIWVPGITNESWTAIFNSNVSNPYGGGPYHKCTYFLNTAWAASDYDGDSLDLYEVGYVLSPWSNPGSHNWDGSAQTFVSTSLGLEVISYTPIFQRYTLSIRAANPEDLSPSKPHLGFNPIYLQDGGPPIEYGWIYLAWGADQWDGQPIEPDVNWSELQRKIGTGSWTTVYSGPNRTWSDNSIIYDPNGETPVYFRVRVRDSQNKWSLWSDTYKTARTMNQQKAGRGPITGEMPERFELSQNFPNPFNPNTTIRYELPEDSYVTLKVYDVLGKEVKTLVDELKEAGYYHARFDVLNLPSGVYFYRMTAGDFVSVRKLIVIR